MTLLFSDKVDTTTLSRVDITVDKVKVHKEGKARVGLFTKDIAESKTSSITSFSRQNGMPLRVTAEPA